MLHALFRPGGDGQQIRRAGGKFKLAGLCNYGFLLWGMTRNLDPRIDASIAQSATFARSMVNRLRVRGHQGFAETPWLQLPYGENFRLA